MVPWSRVTTPSSRPATAPSTSRFHVTDDGTVDFDAGTTTCSHGRGTSTLRVLGVPVTLHPTGSPRPLLPMWGGCHEPIDAHVHTVRMPPGTAYEIRLGLVPSAVLEFSVAADGRVDYPHELRACALRARYRSADRRPRHPGSSLSPGRH